MTALHSDFDRRIYFVSEIQSRILIIYIELFLKDDVQFLSDGKPIANISNAVNKEIEQRDTH